MRRGSIPIAALAAVVGSAAACSSPTFVATGRFATEKAPACAFCSAQEWHPAWAFDASSGQQKAASDPSR